MAPGKYPFSELLRIRRAQLDINLAIIEKSFQVPIHLALGHEAIAVSVATAMGSEDQLVLSHRNIHYHLALGATYEQLFAEYALHPEGLGGGRFGSMNLIATQNRNIYTSNILGNNLAVALGIAQSGRIQSNNQVTWVVTGDGAMEEGVFYESLLSASSWKLPIIIIIENNGWSLGTEISERRVNIDVQNLCHSLGAEYLSLSNNKLDEYVTALAEARAIAKEGKPVVVEAFVESLGGYFVDEPNGSRYINYHAGSAKISTDNWIIAEDSSDPLFVNRNRLHESVE